MTYISPFTVLYCSGIVLLFFTVLFKIMSLSFPLLFVLRENFYYLEYRLKQPFNYGCFFWIDQHRWQNQEFSFWQAWSHHFQPVTGAQWGKKKKRRIASASFSDTKCTKDVNIISQNTHFLFAIKLEKNGPLVRD